MAHELDNGEFWLPPQFLTDDDILMDYRSGNSHGDRSGGDKLAGEADFGIYFPHDFPYGFGSSGPYSDLSSPVESVMGSTETESDEEDLVAGLTRKMAHSTLQNDLWKADTGLGCENDKSWTLSGSPQSTLCSLNGGCGCKQGSSHGSPNCASKISSPPPATLAALSRSDAALDLLCAAAGEVARMRMIEEGTGYHQYRGLIAPIRKPNTVPDPLKKPNSSCNVGFHSNQSLYYKQLQVAQFHQLKQQQMLKQQGSGVWGQSKASLEYQRQQVNQMIQNRAKSSNGRSQCLTASGWPTLQQSQQQHGSGMRAVFLGNPTSKRECAGTGVFLPRQIGNQTETRKNPACSMVLLPDRVVQALNLNLESMDGQPQLQPRYSGNVSSNYDGGVKYRNNVAVGQQRRSVRPQPVVMSQELRLPQEWTY